MDKKDIVAFFDRCAPQWDAEMIRSDEIIAKILDGAEVTEGKHILDVACGTGVLVPDYLQRNVATVTGIDISTEMIRIAREKFSVEKCVTEDAQEESVKQESLAKVKLICGDVEEVAFEQQFDCIMIYNAFPHFPEPERLIHKLASLLKPQGTLTVAHGMSRVMIDRHHEGAASKVSLGLMHEDALAQIFEKDLDVIVKISDERMYQVTGKKKVLHS